MNDNVKTIDELMEYLNSKGIETKEDDRQDLINYGYFHGYKGIDFLKIKIINYQLKNILTSLQQLFLTQI